MKQFKVVRHEDNAPFGDKPIDGDTIDTFIEASQHIEGPHVLDLEVGQTCLRRVPTKTNGDVIVRFERLNDKRWRASKDYNFFIEWISRNDEGLEMDAEVMSGMATIVMVASRYQREPLLVAEDVIAIRRTMRQQA